MSSHDATRRAVMAAMAALPLTAHSASSNTDDDMQRSGSRTLVAYFSRSGNTRVIAGIIHRQLHTDLFEIRPAAPYPEDYLETVEQARKERDSGAERALASKVSSMADYDTVFLGFPIWGETAPPVVRAFLSAHELSGKTIVPVITHGGYGLGNSLSVIARQVPKARVLKGYVIEADQERRTLNQVSEWLKEVQVKR